MSIRTVGEIWRDPVKLMGGEHLAMPVSHVPLMQRLAPGEVVLEHRCKGGGIDVHGVVVQTEHRSDFIEECWLLTSRRSRHTGSPSWRPEIVDHRHGAKLPENPTNIAIALSGQNDTRISGEVFRRGVG